jgi:hypothetical protein
MLAENYIYRLTGPDMYLNFPYLNSAKFNSQGILNFYNCLFTICGIPSNTVTKEYARGSLTVVVTHLLSYLFGVYSSTIVFIGIN